MVPDRHDDDPSDAAADAPAASGGTGSDDVTDDGGDAPPDDGDDGPPGGDDGPPGGDDGGRTWYAVEALSGTKDATVDLLWPPEAGVWLRLALLALFVGGSGGLPTGGGNVGSSVPAGDGGGGVPSGAPPLPDVPIPGESVVALVVGVVALLVILAVVFAAVAGVLEFVLVESLRSREVSIRSRFGAYLGPGLRLFGFRVVVGVVGLAVVAVPLVVVFALGVAVSPAFVLLVIPVFGVLLVAALALWVVNRVTTDFVVPAMLAEDRGVLDGWRRVWPAVRDQWAQVGVYLLLRVGIGIGAGIAVGLATLLVLLVVAIPFALLGGAVVLLGGWSTAALVVAAILAATFGLVALVVSLLVQVVPMTFLRYYSLAVLGLLEAELDLVPWLGEVGSPP
jgi:hypothetical protein